MTTSELLSHLQGLGVSIWAEGEKLRINAPAGVLTERVREQVIERKTEILGFLTRAARSAASLAPALPALTRVSRESVLPLSFAQQRLWFIEQLQPGSPTYNIPAVFRLEGPLHLETLTAVLSEISRRHEVLRTTFPVIDGKPVQAIAPPVPVEFPVVDLSALSVRERRREEARLVAAEARRPFDLSRGPLFRVLLLRLDEDASVIVLNLHHTVSDGWSMEILFRELSLLHEAFEQHKPSLLPEIPIQYVDFACWQRQWLRGETLEAEVSYWRDQLRGSPPVLELPTDRPRPSVQTSQGATRRFQPPEWLAASVASVARQGNVTSFMLLLAVFLVLLNRYSGQEDLSVGTPIAGRHRAETEGVIGLFVNTLVLRTDLSGNPRFLNLLARIRKVTLEAYQHQDLPFEKLVEEIRPERSLSHSPLFQVMFALQNFQSFTGPARGVRRLGISTGVAKFDLSVMVTEGPGRLAGGFEYNLNLFDGSTIQRMVEHFTVLLEGIATRPESYLSELPWLTSAERQQLLWEWNDTGSPETGTLLHALFEEQAKRTPNLIAVVRGESRLTYRDLNARAEGLAEHLRTRGVGPEEVVGLCIDRSEEMVEALLGILKAGAAYLPLDPSYPRERLSLMMEDAGVRVLLTRASLVRTLPSQPGVEILTLETVGKKALSPRGFLPRRPPSESLAYLIYTSGSTGRPKGVAISHDSAVALIRWSHEIFGEGELARVLASTSLNFDLSVFELFVPLSRGGTVFLADNALALTDRRGEMEPTLLNTVPSAMTELLRTKAVPASVETVNLAGEPLRASLVQQIYRQSAVDRVYNLYGPSEDTTYSTFTRIDRNFEGEPPIGRPISSTQIYVLDARGNLAPVGVPGELYLGGAGLARGYFEQPDLTAERFLPHPFAPEPGARVYRTGDRARYRPDGRIDFLGRLDTQIKVRGYRIEPAEIETALASHRGVREAIVLVRESASGDRRLVACVIPEGEQSPTFAELRRFLKARLPEYMLPSEMVLYKTWPVTPSGKIDHRALLEDVTGQQPTASRSAQGETEALPKPVEAPPETELQHIVADIWKRVIGVEEIGIRENFFDLGGHSLLMTEVQVRLGEALGREVAIVDLFRYPTVAALAEFLDEAVPAAQAAVAPSRGPAQGSAVAIIGMAGRFPGASDLEGLWRNLSDGVESITFFSDEELTAAGVDVALLADPAYVRARGVIAGADLFDAAFFDCPPREAEILDPQQRVFLECAWEALEVAGYVPETCPGRVGVYAGLSENTYAKGLYADPDLVRSVGLHQLSVANKPDYLPTRVSYKLNLKGPSVNVQTACSTSLTAVHLACRALLDGECEMALAGGVSIRCPQTVGYRYEEGSIASPDGHVRAFDARAGGTVGGNGAGVVLLKRLDDALADGDTIRAVILGSAINNDGSSKVGFTAPSIEGQAEVIRRAHGSAGVDPETITYIEAHGTGTAVGDPIEVAALTEAFRSATPRRGFCALGTIKTNIGHLDAAAGIAGLIKAVLCLEQRSIPPSLHFAVPNPRIDFNGSPFFVNTVLAEWPAAAPCRAGVSSFGIGGTNAHAVLEEAPAFQPGGSSRPAQLLLLSARTVEALEAATAQLTDHLERHPEIDLADVAYTLQTGRRAFRHRRMVVCENREKAIRSLRDGAILTGEPVSDPNPVVFLFPGQGVQRAGMGAGLYAAEPTFREVLDRASEILAPELGLDLRDLLGPAAAGAAEAELRLTNTRFAQPALFAVEYALAQLLMEWGIRPQAMLGHSLGEYVAACLAGVFTLEEGLRLVAARGRLMGEIPPGGMVAVALPEEEAQALIEDLPELSLAAVNAPTACTLSGPTEALTQLRERLHQEGVEHRLLRTLHAFHSHMSEPILERFTDEVRRVALRPPEVPYLSNVTGTWITTEQALDPTYWGRQLRQTVRFRDGVAALLAGPNRILLEVGPGHTLSTLAKQQPAASRAAIVVNALGRTRDPSAEPAAVVTALGRLWLSGAAVAWRGFYARERRCRIPLPTYPFERRRYWHDGQTGRSAAPAVGVTRAVTPTAGPGRSAPGNAIERGVAAVFEEILGVSGIKPFDDFFELGGSSLMAVQLGARLRQTLGVELPSGVLVEASTVAALAERIAASLPESGREEDRKEDRSQSSCLVHLRTGGSKNPLFLVHQAGGHVYSYRTLAQTLSSERPLYGLRSRGLEENEEPLTSIEEMAGFYLELVREVQPRGPYLLGGASMGGLVALEMTQQLLATGEEVPLLTLMDTPCREILSGPPPDEVILAQVLPPSLHLPVREIRGLAPEEQLARALERAGTDGISLPAFEAGEARRLLHVYRANITALFAYEPRTCEAPMLFFRARERRPDDPARPEQPWIDLARGGIEIHVVPGNHVTMHDLPQVETLATRLASRLEVLG